MIACPALGGLLHPGRRRALPSPSRRDTHRSPASACPSRLQDEETAFLHRELDILHVAVVALEPLLDSHELVIDLGHAPLEGGDGLRRADARHHVFTLALTRTLRRSDARRSTDRA